MHSALIPVNSLAGMKVHEELGHNDGVRETGGRAQLVWLAPLLLPLSSILEFCHVSRQNAEDVGSSLPPLLLPGSSGNQQHQAKHAPRPVSGIVLRKVKE